MMRVFMADNQPEVRSALRLLLQDLGMQLVGEAANLAIALAQTSGTQPDVVVEWDMIPADTSLAETRSSLSSSAIWMLAKGLRSLLATTTSLVKARHQTGWRIAYGPRP